MNTTLNNLKAVSLHFTFALTIIHVISGILAFEERLLPYSLVTNRVSDIPLAASVLCYFGTMIIQKYEHTENGNVTKTTLAIGSLLFLTIVLINLLFKDSTV